MGGLRPHGSALRAQISQIRDGISPLNQPALIMSIYFPKFVTENPPSASQPWSCLILSRFPKFVTENHPSASQPWSCLILSSFPKFVTENPPSANHFPSQIWEALIVSDLVQISQIRDGKSTLSQPFSVTNLGNPDRVWSCPALIVFDLDQSVWIRDEEGEELWQGVWYLLYFLYFLYRRKKFLYSYIGGPKGTKPPIFGPLLTQLF